MNIGFKFTLAANITGFQLEKNSMQREHKTLIWNVNKLDNYDSTPSPLESDLSYRLQIQKRMCNIPTSEIFESRILGMVCFRDLVQSLYNNLNEVLKLFHKNKYIDRIAHRYFDSNCIFNESSTFLHKICVHSLWYHNVTSAGSTILIKTFTDTPESHWNDGQLPERPFPKECELISYHEIPWQLSKIFSK